MSNLDFTDLTCVIPTHNRSPFLRRQLAHLEQCEHFPRVLVVDSSDDARSNENQEIVRRCSRVQVNYRLDRAPFFEKLTAGLSSVKTPFVVLCADDDTLAPAGLAACLQVMRERADLGAAMGQCYVLNTGENKLTAARGFALEHADPIRRMQLYLNHWFSNYYAVHKREWLIQQLRLGQAVIAPSRSRLLNELLDSLLAVAVAPMAFVDADYLTYQIHDDNLSKNSKDIEDPSEFDMLTLRVGEAIHEYMGDCSVAMPSNARGRIHRLLKSYLSAQRIPGRKRSRLKRMSRELQRARLRIFGSRMGSGSLASRKMDFDTQGFRDADMRRGCQLTIANPAGIHRFAQEDTNPNSGAAA